MVTSAFIVSVCHPIVSLSFSSHVQQLTSFPWIKKRHTIDIFIKYCRRGNFLTSFFFPYPYTHFLFVYLYYWNHLRHSNCLSLWFGKEEKKPYTKHEYWIRHNFLCFFYFFLYFVRFFRICYLWSRRYRILRLEMTDHIQNIVEKR